MENKSENRLWFILCLARTLSIFLEFIRKNKGETIASSKSFPAATTWGTLPFFCPQPPTPPLHRNPCGAVKLSTHYLRHGRYLKTESVIYGYLCFFVTRHMQMGKIEEIEKQCAKYTDDCFGQQISQRTVSCWLNHAKMIRKGLGFIGKSVFTGGSTPLQIRGSISNEQLSKY